MKCKNCKKEIDDKKFIQNLNVCTECDFHDYLSAIDRIKSIADEGSFIEFAESINSVDFLEFYDIKKYSDRLSEARLKSGQSEAIITGECSINGLKASIGVMDFNFMGGSMGSVVGEKVRIAADNSIKKRIPLIIFSASGGARMQEGIISLMQMAKTVSAINRLKIENIPYF